MTCLLGARLPNAHRRSIRAGAQNEAVWVQRSAGVGCAALLRNLHRHIQQYKVVRSAAVEWSG